MNSLKPALDWLKENWLNVALIAVAVIALPVMYFVSSGMNASTRKAVEADIAKQNSELQGVKVDYRLEPVTPDEKGLQITMPPNAATTDAMKSLLIKTKEQAASVKARMLSFNKGDRSVLVEGLFPAPASKIDEGPLADDMARRVIPAHADLLRRVGALAAPDQAEVTQRVDELRFREEETTKANRPDGKLTDEDRKAVTEKLSKARLEIYSARALQARFYAEPSVFVSLKPWAEKEPPTLAQCWEWQWEYWVHEMVLGGLANANSDSNSGVFGAALKRLERIEVAPLADKGPGGEAPSDPTAAVPSDPLKSLSTRAAWPYAPNGLYDIRYAEVTILAASDRLPRIIDALSETNLMTVVGMDVRAADDLGEHLRQGYVYTRGGDHIVRARLRVETVWLREWLAGLMPDIVKARLGYPGVAPLPGAEGDPAAASAPAAPPPPPARGGKSPTPPTGLEGKKEGGGGNRGRKPS